MNKLKDLSEISLVEDIMYNSLERNCMSDDYKDRLIYLQLENISSDVYKVFPFNTLGENGSSITKYPSLNIDYSSINRVLTPLISNHIETYEQYIYNKSYSDKIYFSKYDVGWLYINHSLNYLIGEVFFRQYIIDTYIDNLRRGNLNGRRNIHERNLIFLSVEGDEKKDGVSLIFDHISTLFHSIDILDITVLSQGHRIYHLSNHNYLYIIPDYYLSFCDKDLVIDLVK